MGAGDDPHFDSHLGIGNDAHLDEVLKHLRERVAERIKGALGGCGRCACCDGHRF